MDRHHHRRVEEEYPPPPPAQVTHVHHSSHNTTPSPAPPQVSSHVHHSSHNTTPSPPPPQVSSQVHHSSHYTTPSPPSPPRVSSQVHHSSHDTAPPPPQPTTHHTASHDFYQPQPPTPHPAVASVQHVSHTSTTTTTHHGTSHNSKDPLANKPTVKVYCKAKTDYALTIRDGKVILAPSKPSDPLQHWVKDEKYSTRVKDEEGFPAFSLVNKATGQAMKHSIGATHPVQLIPYNPDHLDESILWTESKDLGDTYKAVRMVNNIRLNVDAFNGDKEHGGVHDGTKIVLWEWAKGDNQRWKIVPY